MLKKWYEKNKNLIRILIISALMFIGIMVVCQIIPFGMNSLMAGDIAGQYIPFWSYFKDCFLGKQSIFYSFSKLLGGNMFGIWAYYLMSPFNIVFLMFSKEALVEAVVLVTGLKIVASAITMYIYLKDKIKNKFFLTILAISYAFSGYVVAFQINVMWLDNVILLPLIVLGIEKINSKDDYKLYVITMSLSLIFNFYIGFATAIFSALYYLFIKLKTNNFKKFISKSVKFALYSILAALISAIIILPVIHTLKQGRGSSFFIDTATMFKSNFTILELLSKNLVGAINDSQVFNGLPNVYIGILILILVEMYFLNKKIPLKDKLISLIFILIMIISFKTNIINLMWHGFKTPVGFLYRYSFTFIFLLITIAAENIRKIEEKSEYSVKNIILLSVINIAVLFLIKNKTYEWVSKKALILSGIFLVTYLIIFIIYKYRKNEILLRILSCVFIVEIALNYILTIKQINYLEPMGYKNAVQINDKVIQETKEYDDSFARIVNTQEFYSNESLLFNYNGIGHSSSTFEQYETEFIKKIGFNWHMDFTSYGFGNTLITDSLLGVKYKLSKNDEEYYDKVKDLSEEYQLYKNKYELPIGYITNNYIENVELDKGPFYIQEELLNKIADENIKYFNNVKSKDVKLVNVEKTDGCYYKRTNNEENNAYIELTYDLNKVNEELYFLVDTPYFWDESAFKLYVNDELIDSYIGANKQGIIKIDSKKHENNSNTKIKLIFNNDENIKINDFILKELNLENFEKSYNKIKENGELKNIEYKNNKLKAEIKTNEDEYLFTTIPYIDGWVAKVDGKKGKIENSNGIIMLKLNEGEHEIELKYTPKGIKIGAVISLISLSIFITINILKNKRLN